MLFSRQNSETWSSDTAEVVAGSGGKCCESGGGARLHCRYVAKNTVSEKTSITWGPPTFLWCDESCHIAWSRYGSAWLRVWREPVEVADSGTFCHGRWNLVLKNKESFSKDLETVNNEVDGTVDDNEKVGESNQNIHPWAPDLLIVWSRYEKHKIRAFI